MLLDGAPRAERAAELRLATERTCKCDDDGSRALSDKINFDSPAVARFDVEAQTEHRIASVHRSHTVGRLKTDRSSLARPPRHSEASEGSSVRSSSTAASTVSARVAMWSR